MGKGRADAKAWAEQTGVLALLDESQQPDPDAGDAQQKSRMQEVAF